MSNEVNHKIKADKSNGLGTFGGVFTPSILTILGVIMYLRFGWVVGNVGLLGTLIIVTLATSITFLTGLSIASIATDQKVKTGGAYYMISRSLGIESGGAIGVSLYIAQALSVALYTVGFAESVVAVFPSLNEKWLGIITIIIITGITLGSAKAAIRAQYVIMVGIGLSLLALFLGSPIEETKIELWGVSEGESESFWTVFAVFFPAVTGIMAGVNMSGDLKDPKKSIPRGTFAAIGVGYLIYMTLPILLAFSADAKTLVSDPLIMRKISLWGDSILIGVWGATLSSAMGSIMGAPRVLQALAKDNMLPKFLKWVGRGSGEYDTPRYGTVFTLVIVLVVVWIGDLNAIAPILTMFFLTTYGVLNIAAGTERFLGSPSFRPTFKVNWIFSLAGAISCFAVMLLINFSAALITFLFIGLLFFWIKRRQMQTSWGSINRGVKMAIIRSNLIRLSDEGKDAKNWRPNPMVLAGSPSRRWYLIEFANSFTQSQGILTVSSVLTDEKVQEKRIQSLKENIKEYMAKRGVEGLVKVYPAKNRFEGAVSLVSAYGLGGLEPNTIILGETNQEVNTSEFCLMVERFYEMKRNVLIVHRGEGELSFGAKMKIDVWWGGLKGNGGLMMILSYLLKQSIDWRQASICIKMVVEDGQAVAKAESNLKNILSDIRIEAETDIIAANGRNFDDILIGSSGAADLIFLGMAVPGNQFEGYYRSMKDRIKNLPTTVLCLAAQDVSFGEVLMSSEDKKA